MTAAIETAEAVALALAVALVMAALPVVGFAAWLWYPREQAVELPVAVVVQR